MGPGAAQRPTTCGSRALTTDPRSRTTRQLAESALVRLLDAADPAHRSELVLVGGLVPEYLARTAPVEHQGTTDVDVVLSVGFVYDRDELDFGWLERALEMAGFRVDPRQGGGWRWLTTVEGVPVKLELLCDVPGDPSNQVVSLPGCRHASAVNLQGPGAALQDAVTRTLSTHQGPRVITTAGLGGYVLSKASAAASRAQDRDFYDLAYVLIHNDLGGPGPAAEAVITCLAGLDDPAGTAGTVYLPRLRAALAELAEGQRQGAWIYARESVRTGSIDSEQTLVEDATSAAFDVLRQLDEAHPRRRP